ncbi:hypothetical protein IQ274_25050 [Nostoc sp. LEGE 12447]|uniref:hypothetical protein n=1 Tax=Nostoc sp. LEGE 12447 TaxID=1828640 RepID=UPI001884747F|nr:hypothetical protein [Nostoc sp. LEGE 12447]MBE9001395.1 hypothetical protein [Nostoc sp. LEGE 12447]
MPFYNHRTHVQVSNSAGVIPEESLVLETQGDLTVIGAVSDEEKFHTPIIKLMPKVIIFGVA